MGAILPQSDFGLGCGNEWWGWQDHEKLRRTTGEMMLNMRERDKGVDSTMYEYIISLHDVQHCVRNFGKLEQWSEGKRINFNCQIYCSFITYNILNVVLHALHVSESFPNIRATATSQQVYIPFFQRHPVFFSSGCTNKRVDCWFWMKVTVSLAWIDQCWALSGVENEWTRERCGLGSSRLVLHCCLQQSYLCNVPLLHYQDSVGYDTTLSQKCVYGFEGSTLWIPVHGGLFNLIRDYTVLPFNCRACSS